VYHRLTELGVHAWFDEEAMRGDINHTVTFLESSFFPFPHGHFPFLSKKCP